MEIGKFNQMKAYLLKPKRLFTNKQDTIGGGNFTGQDLGSRSGFAQITQLKQKGPYSGKFSLRRRDPDTGGMTQFYFDTKEEAVAFDKKATDEGKIRRAEKLRAQQVANTQASNDFRQSIHRWVTNWFEENAGKYDIKDGEKAIKQLKKDYKDAGFEKPKGVKANVFSPHGNFPNLVSAGTKNTMPYSAFGLSPFVEDSVNPDRSLQSYKYYFQKAFLRKKIMEDPNFKNRIERYMEYVSINKPPGGKGLALLKEQYADVLDDADDITFLLSDDSGLKGFARSTFLRDTFDNYESYSKKMRAASLNYKKNIATIEKTLGPKKLKQILNGETSILAFMEKENNKLKKLFDTKDLPQELKYSIDHNIGIADISRLSKSEMERYLQSLVGMTVDRNFELGWRGGYSAKKKSYISKIKEGKDVEKNLELLNDLTKDVYPELKGKNAYSIDKGKLTVTEDFFFPTNEKQRFQQYFTEILGKKGATEQVLKQAAGSPELVKFIQDIEGGNFKNFNKVVSQYQKGKIDFGKELDYYCKVAGKRITAATGMVPGATCSSADIERGMRTDAKTPEGRERLTKVAKNFGKIFGKIVAPIDIGIEGAFALPHLLRGDAEGAIAATTAGFFGAGKDAMEQVGERFGTDSPEYALYGAENAVQQKMTAIAGLDKLLMQNRQLGIIPEESGEFKKGIGRQPQEEALRKNFTTSFLTLSKLDQGATEDFAKYYPLTADLTQRNKAIQNVRGLSDEIQATGMFKNIKGPSDQTTIEGFLETAGGRSKFPILPRFDLPALRAQATDYTGMDYLDRVSDMPTDIAAQVPAFEKAQIGPGIKRYAMEFGPKAAKEFFDAQGIDTQPYLEGMAPLLYKANGGRIGLKEGLTPGQQGPMGPVFTTSDPKEAAKEVVKRLIKIDNAKIPLDKKLSIALQGVDGASIEGVIDFLGGELSFGAGKKGSDKGIGFNFYKQFANGGRIKYAEGPEDPSKRKFLKNVGIGGGIAGGFMTGLLNLVDLFKGGKKGVVATKAAESEAEKIFLDLVNVVKNKGILKRLDDPSELKQGEIYEYKGVKVLEDGENIEVRFDTDKGAPAVVEYRKPGYEVDPDAGTSVQVPGEFIGEAQEVGRIRPDGDVDLDFEEEIIDPIENIKKIASE